MLIFESTNTHEQIKELLYFGLKAFLYLFLCPYVGFMLWNNIIITYGLPKLDYSIFLCAYILYGVFTGRFQLYGLDISMMSKVLSNDIMCFLGILFTLFLTK